MRKLETRTAVGLCVSLAVAVAGGVLYANTGSGNKASSLIGAQTQTAPGPSVSASGAVSQEDGQRQLLAIDVRYKELSDIDAQISTIQRGDAQLAVAAGRMADLLTAAANELLTVQWPVSAASDIDRARTIALELAQAARVVAADNGDRRDEIPRYEELRAKFIAADAEARHALGLPSHAEPFGF